MEKNVRILFKQDIMLIAFSTFLDMITYQFNCRVNFCEEIDDLNEMLSIIQDLVNLAKNNEFIDIDFNEEKNNTLLLMFSDALENKASFYIRNTM